MAAIATYRANHTATATTWSDGQIASHSAADNTPDGKLHTRTWARGVITEYSYDTANSLTNILYSDTTPDVTFTYDRLGRMTSATSSAQSAAFYSYDLIGNRISASETIGGETLNKAYTANELNQHTAIANPAYVGLRGSATNGATVTVNGHAVYSDANGNITQYITTNDALAAHYEYSPFGETIVKTGPLADSFTHRFSTKPWCEVTRLSEDEYRKHNPSMGKWLSRDSIVELWMTAVDASNDQRESLILTILWCTPEDGK